MACGSGPTASDRPAGPPAPTQLTGRQLAQAYCGTCHLPPDPSLLDKTTWQRGVLPQMALRMGLSDARMTELMRLGNETERFRLLEANTYPETPMVNPADWQKIVNYYVTKAPEHLPAQPAHAPVRTELPLFRVEPTEGVADSWITLLRYDSLTHRTWVGDRRGRLCVLDSRLRLTDSLRFGSPVVDLLNHRDGSTDVLTVGVMNPNDQQAGAWGHVASHATTLTTRLTGLERPVGATVGDLNQDGRDDVVISQFGNHLGQLSWFEQGPGHRYQEHVLDNVPGARLTYIRDVDHDGWPDIVALLTQGDEQIAVYRNQHNREFEKRTVLRFPPVYGSSYLELADMDGDGDEDLVYTNGDNADYSIILKPYHGVRVFLNDGQFHFRQSWFYPMHGATQTVVRDFDHDGDPDIAAIAHFPDYGQRPAQSFVYLENTGRGQFTPRTFAGANRGRWLTMTAGDVDGDGDDDILLGSFFRPAGSEHADLMRQWSQPGAGVWLLRNTLR